MQIHKLPYTAIPQLSATDLAYQTENPRLRPFYSYAAKLECFGEIIQKKHFGEEKRQILSAVLNRQYSQVEIATAAAQNLHKIGHLHSYTVTTAHQPSLFTGPLYFVYKIAGIIHLSRLLQKHYPQYHFIPIYWMGGEDHDFEEVNHLNLFHKTLVWEDWQGGAVADYQIESLLPILNELNEILGSSPNAEVLKTMLQEAFRPEYNYGEAMFRFINALFGAYGLLVLIPNAPELKRQMIPIFENDLTLHDSKILVDDTVAALTAAGFKNQAYVRQINLFYLQEGRRERIELIDGVYTVLHTDLTFNKKQILSELQAHPERFSPNVILRPLFQEMVLPNLAYIGGGGEIAYWLERKAQFEHFGIPFPMLIRRNSLQWVDNQSFQKMEKLGLEIIDLFTADETLIKSYVEAHASVELSFEAELKEFELTFRKIIDKTVQIDPTLEATAAAQQAQLFNALDKLQTRLMRSEKKKQETEILQIKKLLEKLFPASTLQERKENFMPLYLRHGQAFIDFLVDTLNPLEKDFWVVLE